MCIKPFGMIEARFQLSYIEHPQRAGTECSGKYKKKGDIDKVEIMHIGFQEEPEKKDNDKQAVACCTLPHTLTYLNERV
jgi:hypothetical protein